MKAQVSEANLLTYTTYKREIHGIHGHTRR